MLTKEQINIFAALHERIANLGIKYQFSYGSFGSEFYSVIQDKSGATISLTILSVNNEEENKRLDNYRQLLINFIEHNQEAVK